MADVRTEQDLLGTMEVPDEAYWGIHTARAVENFAFSTRKVHPALLAALARVKRAAAMTNSELGYLDTEKAQAICRACDEIAEGQWLDQFPVDAVQGGAGTSVNMNMNEVLANRALEVLGHARGAYDVIHPIEHVNLHQSTNDVYPTALKVAAIIRLRALAEAAAELQGRCQDREQAFADIVKMGRTELQDAVPMTLGAEFGAFAEAFGRDRWRAFKCEERLRVVNLGGTAVGTGMTAPRRYIHLVIETLREVTGIGLSRGEHTVDATANADAYVEVMGMLDACGANLIKVSRDLRLLHYFGEIRLVPLQAGSSIMPGKVNPVALEGVVSAALRARANGTAVREAASLGTLQINEWHPVIADALLEALDLLCAGCRTLAMAVDTLEADAERCRQLMEASPTLLTAFIPQIGYERAESLREAFAADGEKDFRAFLEEELGKEMVERVLAPASLTQLGYRDD